MPKFDVVVGNPPYQRSTTKAHKLWIDFIELGMKISCKYMLYVVPSLMFDGNTQKISNLKLKLWKNFEYAEFLNNQKYFNVGEKICWFFGNLINPSELLKYKTIDGEIFEVNKNKVSVIYRDETSVLEKSIIKKIECSKDKRLKFVSDYENSDGYATPKYLIERKIIQKEKSEEYCIEFYHSGANRFYTNNNHKFGGKLKVCLNFSSSYKNMFYGYGVIGKQVEGILVESEDDALKMINTLKKKIFVFFIEKEKNGGFNTGIGKLPALDFSRPWTDKELYEYFCLTQEEIDYIETQIR
jgi:site-specific DNA-methyltransferase (adenine-specific)